MPKDNYIAAEPERVSGFLSEDGRFYRDRDSAIHANVRADLIRDADRQANKARGVEHVPTWFGRQVAEFIEKNPDMVRRLLGDLDAT